MQSDNMLVGAIMCCAANYNLTPSVISMQSAHGFKKINKAKQTSPLGGRKTLRKLILGFYIILDYTLNLAIFVFMRMLSSETICF